uniref:Uncharacterized protein n=1 Tax=Mola mola TaxID=94237 RepID=A0A3Q3WNC7_MOLML
SSISGSCSRVRGKWSGRLSPDTEHRHRLHVFILHVYIIILHLCIFILHVYIFILSFSLHTAVGVYEEKTVCKRMNLLCSHLFTTDVKTLHFLVTPCSF